MISKSNIFSRVLCFVFLIQGSIYFCSLADNKENIEDPLKSQWSKDKIHGNGKVAGIPPNVMHIMKQKLQSHSPYLTDGVPHILYSSKKEPKAIVCLNAKCGSSSWKHVFLKELGVSIFQRSFSLNPHRMKFDWMMSEKIPHNISELPRFIFVRNPYVRLLSGFLSKRRYLKLKKFLPNIREGRDITFGEFMDELNSTKADQLEYHFKPLSHLCSFDRGFEYDYILRVEELDLWYEPFISLLGMQETVQNGWNATTGFYSNQNHDACYYNSPGKSCNEMFRPSKHLLNPPKDNDLLHNSHATGSSNLLDKFYTPHLYDMASKFAHEDFINFNYPKWNFSYELL